MDWLRAFPLAVGKLFDWLPPKMSIWLTPMWIVGMGALVALVCLVVIWGVLRIFSRDTSREMATSVLDGPLRPILWVVVAFAAYGVLGAPVALNKGAILVSASRLPFVRTTTQQFPITESAKDQTVDVRLRYSELKELILESDVSLSVSARPIDESPIGTTFELGGGTSYRWVRAAAATNALPEEMVSKFFVRNDTGSPTELKLTIVRQVPHPEAKTIPAIAFAVLAVFAFYLGLQLILPKLSAVAQATVKSELSQPLFIIVLLSGAFLLALFIWIPYNTLGDDIKMFKDSGMTTIKVLAIISALWAASTSVADEIEGRTALTVLSKPIGRRQFILGKYLGICWTTAVMFIVLGAVFLIAVSYKPIYDARETANLDPTWQDCHLAMAHAFPGLLLGFMEAIVLASISVAISTRLPMLANFIICFTIYALGHLTPATVQSTAGEFEAVAFIGQLIATIVPNLENFDIQAAITRDSGVPYHYLFGSLVYCILYGTVAMLLALVMFEDRDLA
jgi:ABC-type transport system involved in multi-copper enzyme maturation permease subunit